MKIPILFALIACAAAVPLHAQPWRFEDIGSFRYRPRFDPITDRDQSEAVAQTAHDRMGGVSAFISWSCEERGLLITITASDAGPDERVRVVYRFDQDRPDTVSVLTWPIGGALSVPDELLHAFTTRARSAARLVVRVIHGNGESDRYFDLAGSDRALGLLACVRDLPPAPAPLPPGEFEASRVDQVPDLINRDEVLRVLNASYPAELRRAGVGGDVGVRVRVRADGTVDRASMRVVHSTDPRFDDAARAVVAAMRFTPAQRAGRPVTVWVNVPVPFGPPRD